MGTDGAQHVLYKIRDEFGDAAAYGFFSERYPGLHVRSPSLSKLAKAVRMHYPVLDMYCQGPIVGLAGDRAVRSSSDDLPLMKKYAETPCVTNVLEIGLFTRFYLDTLRRE